MTTTFKIATTTFAAVTLAALAMAGSAKADASANLLKCNGNSRPIVEKCCAEWTRRNGVPFWMSTASIGCGSSVACVTRSRELRDGIVAVAFIKKPRCWISYPQDDNQGGSLSKGTPTRQVPTRAPVGKP